MKTSLFAVALTSLLSGATLLPATTADGAALLVSDMRSVDVAAVVADAGGTSQFAHNRSHAGFAGTFDAAVQDQTTSPGGWVFTWADASQRSHVTLDGDGRLLEVDVAELGAFVLLRDEGLGLSSDVHAVSRLELVFDVIQSTQLTYSGLEPWDGTSTFAIMDSGGAVRAPGLSLDEQVLTLDAGRYTLLFEADVPVFSGSQQGGSGFLTATFTTPEPGTAGLLLVSAGLALTGRRRFTA
jgi:hypothetical protein